MSERLTRRAVDAWLKTGKNEWLWCGEVRGFGAHRRDGSRAAFVVQFRVGRGRTAQRRRVVLGEYPTMTVEEARQQAAEHISAGWKGNDPVETKRAQRAAQGRQRDTVASMVGAFNAARRPHLKGRSADQYESIWHRLILPDLGTKPVSSVKRREIASVMDEVERTAGPSVADRVHEQLSLFFRWYAERDDDFTSPLVRTMKRHRAGSGAHPMTDMEIRQFWSACADAGIAGVAGRFCLLTATRRNETTRATWPEISSDGVFTIPPHRYKTKREHIVPLSQAALDLLSDLDKASPYLFGIGDGEPDNWTLWLTIVAAGGPNRPGLSWHSLRKTGRTLMSRAGVRSDHAERALGHVQGAIERAYDKHDYQAEKRSAFEALAMQLQQIINFEYSTEANVVRLRNAA